MIYIPNSLLYSLKFCLLLIFPVVSGSFLSPLPLFCYSAFCYFHVCFHFSLILIPRVFCIFILCFMEFFFSFYPLAYSAFPNFHLIFAFKSVQEQWWYLNKVRGENNTAAAKSSVLFSFPTCYSQDTLFTSVFQLIFLICTLHKCLLRDNLWTSAR